ncbi:GNAT family N-acetyltransferase [Roseiconus nitratireducens]|uniref:GNAT family N-acetyltransferase n=1 Tax=Roseiconus nitratireducens TaxID=2605748 RepID=A0A5M6DAG4_9BACT|nr:GNAT family N-acetyltransferase [Roseiconus nitratireducens]
MSARDLDAIFRPSSVAVVGASDHPLKVGYTVLKNLLEGGFSGKVFPVNLRRKTVQQLEAYPSVTDLPQPVDLVVICTPAATVPDLVAECGKFGVGGLIIVSAGFRETGAAGIALQQRVSDAAKAYPELAIIGPNCLGVISPHAHLNASFSGSMPEAGRIAFVSQSGALCTSVLDWARRDRIGFSYFVSIGNMMDVGMADLIDYFHDDPGTDAVILYIESIQHARAFMSATRSFTRNRPIVAYKAGRFAESAKAAASHTGAMAGVDDVYEAALARAGVVRVREVRDIFDCAQLLAQTRRPRGDRLAIVTNAGGPGVMAIDQLVQLHGTLATLSDSTIDSLDHQLPAAWSRGNPVDVLGDADPARFAKALRGVLRDDGVDAALVILTPQAMTDPLATAKAVIESTDQTTKPVLASWVGGNAVQEGIAALRAAGIPAYSFPEEAVRAFMYLNTYARRRELLYETPKDLPVEFVLNRERLRPVFNTILSEGRQRLTESMSKAMLDAYEIPISRTFVARTPEDAVEYAHRLGYPVAVKVFSPDISHKTDVGGVALGVVGDDAVRDAYDRILQSAKEARPDAYVEGVTVQPMISSANGIELIVGARRDPVFGPVLMVGSGGTGTELLRDRTLELPPLNERLARNMLQSLRCWPLLQGYRGRPSVTIDKLVEVLMRFSYLIADYPEICELDVNPLLVTPSSVVALDARIILDHQTLLHPVKQFSHLAIRPYPENYCRSVALDDGTKVLLRPIKPEDEPMWHAMLSECSPETLHNRFRSMLGKTSHDFATRFCFIDYDREMAIVAEIHEAGKRQLVGVGRLVAGTSHEDAEYTVLVVDAWQNRGLGTALTGYCMEIAGSWGLTCVVAETDRTNARMLAAFRRYGFRQVAQEDGVVSLQYQVKTQ